MCLNAQCRVAGCFVRVVGGGALRTNTSTSLAFMLLEMETCHRFSILILKKEKEKSKLFLD